MIVEEALLSSADVGAEALLMQHHDIAALRARLERNLRLRMVLGWLSLALLAAFITGGIAFLPFFSTSRMTVLNRAEVSSPALHVARDIAPEIPIHETDRQPTATRSAPPAKPRATKTTATTKKSTALAKPTTTTMSTEAPTTETEATATETSRLRRELRAIENAQQALDAGDAGRALVGLRQLRADDPDGPVDVDAAALIVTALHALARDDEARAALIEVEHHAHARERGAAIARLHRILDASREDDDDDYDDEPVRR